MPDEVRRGDLAGEEVDGHGQLEFRVGPLPPRAGCTRLVEDPMADLDDRAVLLGEVYERSRFDGTK